MQKPLKKIVSASNKIVDLVQARLKKEVNALAKSKVISTKEAKQLLKAAAKEAQREKKRVQAFIKAELKRELKRAKPKIKKAVAKKRKQFESYRKKRKRR